MGKKFSLNLQRPKCVKCGHLLQTSKRQSSLNKGKITAYCFNRKAHDDNAVIKFYIESMISKAEPEAQVIMKIKQAKAEYA